MYQQIKILITENSPNSLYHQRPKATNSQVVKNKTMNKTMIKNLSP
jgi:hypothetical protein